MIQTEENWLLSQCNTKKENKQRSLAQWEEIYSAERSSGNRRPRSQQYKRLHQSSAPGLSSDGGTEIGAAGLMQGRWGSFSYTWLVNKAFNSRPQKTNLVVFLFLNGRA